MESCRPHRHQPHPCARRRRTRRRPAPAHRRRGRAGRRRPRRQGARPAPDEDAGDRSPAGRDRGLPARQVGRGGRRAGWVGTSAPRPRPRWSARWPTGSPSRRSSGGRWACRSRTPRSSRARRTSSATASATSSARTSWPRTWCATSSGASRSPGAGGVDRAGAPRRTGHRRARDRREGHRHRAARRGRAGGHRPGPGPQAARAAGRRWAPCWRGSSTTGRTTGSSTSCATRPTTGCREPHHRAADRRAAGADLVAPVRRRDHRGPGVPRGPDFAWAVKTDPEHPLRKAIDTFLVEFAGELQRDDDTIERVERIKYQIVEHPRCSGSSARRGARSRSWCSTPPRTRRRRCGCGCATGSWRWARG